MSWSVMKCLCESSAEKSFAMHPIPRFSLSRAEHTSFPFCTDRSVMLWIPVSPLWEEPENTGPTTSKARPRMQSDAKAVTCRMQLPDVARKQGNAMKTQWKYNGNAMEMRCKLDWYLSDPWDASLANTPHRLLHFWPPTNIRERERESLKSCL